MDRAFSSIVIKSIDNDKRIIEGVATTPTPDGYNDIVEPKGAEFKLPLPLLWQHNSSKPIGHVTSAKVTKDGIAFKAKIVKDSESSTIRDRLDEAWESVKSKLVSAVSIGFRPLEYDFIEGNGGIHFKKWKWLELSLVTIPANPDATITQIKAAFGSKGTRNINRPGVSGQKEVSKHNGSENMLTLSERAASLKEDIAPKVARMRALMDESEDFQLEGAAATEYDTLATEVKGMRETLTRLEALGEDAATAKPVTVRTPEDASVSRGGSARVSPEPKKPDEEKGLGFARLVSAYAVANGDPMRALQVVQKRYGNGRVNPSELRQMQMVLRAQVDGGTTTDATWAEPLVEPANLVSEFVEFLRPRTILGKFGVGSIPALRRVPFNVTIPAQTSGGEGYWVGEGNAKPLARFDFARTTLRWCKVANIAVLTDDLVRMSAPSAELTVRSALADALQSRLDRDFVNPAVTAIADVRPAAITNGATAHVCSGVDAAAVRDDLNSLMSTFVTNDIPTDSVVLVMRSAQAMRLSFMRNALGGREFPDMTINGGFLEGIPVIASQYVPSGIVVALCADEIYLADDGGVTIDMSREASLEMDDSPSSKVNDGSSPPVSVEATLVSMFQTNSIAIRAERWVNWLRRRTYAVSYLTGCGWGGADVSPIVEI